jgi:hypothetical protein
MPKQPTFKKIYPTLRNPFKSSQDLESRVTLRERTNLLQPASTLINLLPSKVHIHSLNDQENVLLNTSKTALQYINKDLILEDFSLIASRSTSPAFSLTEQDLHNEMPIDNNKNSDNSDENSDNSDENSDNDESSDNEDNDENSDNEDNDENLDNDENSDNDENFKTTNYYDNNTELPGYIGDSGPYFPSVTAMWIFIWFTKNMIGILITRKYYFNY